MRYLIIGAALAFAGCDNMFSSVKTVKVEGHEYIVYSGPYGGNIIHSENCPCKKNGGAE